jgi:AcrR family transcriptional regulator
MAAEAAARAPGRPRCDATRHAILGAAYDLLTEGGIKAFTIEAVAARAGSAKTTIYRWWPSKGALAIEAFLEANSSALAFPRSASAVADLRAQVRLLARAFAGQAGQVIAGLVAEMQGDEETRRAFLQSYVEPRRAEARRLLERGIASGELRADLDVDVTLDALYGAIYWRLLTRPKGLDEGWVDRMLDNALRGMRSGVTHEIRASSPAT